jgi:hypothetical protein
MSTITIKAEITDQTCADIMCTALEGGIGYWCCAGDIKRTEGTDWGYVSFDAYDDEEVDRDDPESKAGFVGTVTYDTIRKGIERILGGQIRLRPDLLAQVATAPANDDADIDSEAADCIVQAGLLNAIVYG